MRNVHEHDVGFDRSRDCKRVGCMALVGDLETRFDERGQRQDAWGGIARREKQNHRRRANCHTLIGFP
jgi:hypothetical protein